MVSISRGDIYWADLGIAENHSPAKTRPLLIIQVDEITRTAIGTVVGSAITSNTEAADFPGGVYLPKDVTGLPKDSVAKLTELVTIDKWQLEEFVSHIPEEYILRIENALREVLGL